MSKALKWDHAPIWQNGIYTDIPIETYHSDLCIGPSVSSSDLRTVTQHSPAHYWCNSVYNQQPPEPDEEAPKEKEHFALGRAAHHLLLGEEAFSTIFVVRPKQWDDWRKDAAKDWRAEQENAGRTVLIPKQLTVIRGLARSLARNPLVQAGILNGDVEQSFVWKDKETGLWLKSRPDVRPIDSGDFCDLKTTTDVTYDELSRTIGIYGYHQQAALAGEGYKVLTGRPMTSFSFCFAEKTAPWSVRIVTLKECDLLRGAAQNRMAIRQMAECFEKNEWPGPGDYQEAEFIEIPTWLQTRIDRDIEFYEKVWKSRTEKSADNMAAG